jgi:hypothetical protein
MDVLLTLLAEEIAKQGQEAVRLPTQTGRPDVRHKRARANPACLKIAGDETITRTSL